LAAVATGPNDKWASYVPLTSAELTGSLLEKVVPKEHPGPYRILRGIQKVLADRTIVKVIVQRKDTGVIVFFTSVNAVPLDSKHYWSAIADGWYVYKKDMVAPVGFWEMVRDCI
jgi:hypothetical protein